MQSIPVAVIVASIGVIFPETYAELLQCQCSRSVVQVARAAPDNIGGGNGLSILGHSAGDAQRRCAPSVHRDPELIAQEARILFKRCGRRR